VDPREERCTGWRGARSACASSAGRVVLKLGKKVD